MAQNQGSIIVASAGNSNQNLASNPRYPSCYNGVICVANTTQSDAKRGSSCYGSRVDVSAPGSSILSTIPLIIMVQKAELLCRHLWWQVFWA